MKTRKISPAPFPTQAQVAQRARELWEQNGRPENRDLEHWLEAERQLGRRAGLHDDASRLTAAPLDPASSPAAEVDREIDRMGSVSQSERRSATSL